jgi:hypothetical protein
VHRALGSVPGVVLACALVTSANLLVPVLSADSAQDSVPRHLTGRHLFEGETFGGNGRTCFLKLLQ